MALSYELRVIIHYIIVQVKQITPYWTAGLLAGSLITVFAGKGLERLAARIPQGRNTIVKIVLAATVGAVSPVTLHGMIPVLAALMHLNVSQSIIAAFMVSSVLINPNLVIYSLALGSEVAVLRLLLCILAGILAGVIVSLLGPRIKLLEFSGYDNPKTINSVVPGIKAVAYNFWRGILKTAPNLGLGILLAALFQIYMPTDFFDILFRSNRGLSVLYSASLGVPTYYCGGGSIPLIRAWMSEGMSLGSVIAFMLTGPATKMTNLTAVKILMPVKKFWLYIVYSICFGVAAGLLVDLVHGLLS